MSKKIILCPKNSAGLPSVIPYGAPGIRFSFNPGVSEFAKYFTLEFGSFEPGVNTSFRAPRAGVLKGLYFELKYMNESEFLFVQLDVEAAIYRGANPGNSKDAFLNTTELKRTDLRTNTTINNDGFNNCKIVANCNTNVSVRVEAGENIALVLFLRVKLENGAGEYVERVISVQGGVIYE